MPRPNVLDTPKDEAMREDMKRVRIEQGANRKANDKILNPKYGDVFTFRFRQFKNTQFSGLWELCAMRTDGKVDAMIVDADALPNVLEAIGNIFANRGY